MEYGVFVTPQTDWNLMFIALIAFLAMLAFIVCSLAADAMKKRKTGKIEQKKSLFGSGRIKERNNDSDAWSLFYAILAATALITSVVFLVAGLRAGTEKETYNEKDANPGTYRVMEASINFGQKPLLDEKGNQVREGSIFSSDYFYIPNSNKALYFRLRLQGRENSDDPPDLIVTRLFEIPYDRIVENDKYKPSEATLRNHRFKDEYTINDIIPVPIKTPPLIVKHKNGLWKFVEEK